MGGGGDVTGHSWIMEEREILSPKHGLEVKKGVADKC